MSDIAKQAKVRAFVEYEHLAKHDLIEQYPELREVFEALVADRAKLDAAMDLILAYGCVPLAHELVDSDVRMRIVEMRKVFRDTLKEGN